MAAGASAEPLSLGRDPAPARPSCVEVSAWALGGRVCSLLLPHSSWLQCLQVVSVRIHQSLPLPLASYQLSLCPLRKAEVFLSFGKPCFPSILLTQKALQQKAVCLLSQQVSTQEQHSLQLHYWQQVPGVAGQPLHQEEAKIIFAIVLATAKVAVHAPGQFLTDLP